jgi:hypothetical protein
VTHLDQRQRLGIGHVGLGDMKPFGVFAKIINKGLNKAEDFIPFQGAGEVLDAMPTKEQLEQLGNLPSEIELMKRGFDPKTFYHGSPKKNIMEFVPQASDRSEFGGYREARKGVPTTFFSESPGYVEEFAKKGGQEYPDFNLRMMRRLPLESSRIYPVKIKVDNLYNYKNEEHRNILEKKLGNKLPYELMSGDAFSLQQPEISKAIKDLGFRGYFTNEADIGIGTQNRSVGLFYPEKGDVRSVFAQFDPKKAEDGNIYASIIPPVTTAVGVGALAGLEDAT